MGAGQSSNSDSYDKVFPTETPVQFSQDVVNQLADNIASPEISPERQSTLDAHIRSRIQTELARLRQEEEELRNEIERTLEKENLDRERAMTNEEDGRESGLEDGLGIGKVKSSAALMGDLEEVQRKVDKFRSRRNLADSPEAKSAGEAVLQCYKSNPTTPLNCWWEVSEFKSSVAQLEQKYVDLLR